MNDYEALRRLKSQYCHRLDDKDWEGYGELFLEDATWTYDGVGGPPTVYRGRTAIVEHMIDALGTVTGAHHVTTAEIDLISDDEARARWGLLCFQAGGRLVACGHYHEHYRKTDDGWRFQSVRAHMTMMTVTQQFSLLP